ncbi:hypothetical protein MSIMFI_01658 [Mycobacterium simulans]|nr:hypothetical protein MSIMFI_01658 [Mycobacterium simulans]
MRREEERCKANNDVHSLGWEIALLLCVEAAGRVVLRRPGNACVRALTKPSTARSTLADSALRWAPAPPLTALANWS